MTEPKTATERDVRTERASAYRDGGDLGMSHMFDALASGLDVRTAVLYTKEMIESAAVAIEHGKVGRQARAEARAAIRTKYKVELLGNMGNVGHMKLAAPAV